MSSQPTNKYSSTVRNGNVILVEPNSININTTNIGNIPFVNGVPEYQDMYIFAELSAESRGRTLIINNNGSSSNGTKVNLMGVNQDSSVGNPDLNKFTTNYYDGSMGTREVLESFGISSIKVTVNSSYVPQVNIQFIDIRGLSFFNQEKSPYRILFDFPPPIFTLTIKGYYGRALRYQLHLVKYTSEFQAHSGNFVIDADFVAMTFAPLSDILFRYIVNVPLIISHAASPNPASPPVNTNDLIIKLRGLYSRIRDKINTQTETKSYDEILNQQKTIANVLDIINGFGNNSRLTQGGAVPYMMVKTVETNANWIIKNSPPTQPDEYAVLQRIKTSSDYDTIIKQQETDGTTTTFVNRLLIGYVAETNLSSSDTGDTKPTFPSYTGNTLHFSDLSDNLNYYAKLLMDNQPTSNRLTVNSADKNIYNGKNISNDGNSRTRYVVIDITDYYNAIYKISDKLEKQRIELGNQINVKVNAITIGELGMLPTIYNVFKIILDDVDDFFSQLRTVSLNAETEHNKSTAKAIILGEDKSVNPKDNYVYSFPLIVRRSDNGSEERIAPVELSKRTAFPELDFVQNFIDTFQQQHALNIQNDLRNQQNADGSFKWIPISPLDSTIGGGTAQSPYIGLDTSGSSDDKITQVYKILLRRYYILSQAIMPDEFGGIDDNGKRSDAFRTLYANAEASNLAEALSASLNTDFLSKMKDESLQYNSATKISKFYNNIKDITDIDAQGNTIKLTNFPNNTVKGFKLNPNDDIISYVDKGNIDFHGVNLNVGLIEIRDKTSDPSESTDPVEKFFSDAQGSWWKTIFIGEPNVYWYDFSLQNVFYIRDGQDEESKKDSTVDGIVLKSIYLASPNVMSTVYYYQDYYKALAKGNNIWESAGAKSSTNLNSSTDITKVWSSFLGDFGSIVYSDIIAPDNSDASKLLSAMYILSNFGNTYGPFNVVGNDLNYNVFSQPAAVEVPTFFPAYIGALVHALEGDGDILPWVDNIAIFFDKYVNSVAATNSNIKFNNGSLIAADLHDIKNYMSVNDKELFKKEFINFYSGSGSFNYASILVQLQAMWSDATSLASNTSFSGTLTDAINAYINPKADSIENGPSTSTYYSELIKPLIERTNILVYSQITFKMPSIDKPKNPTYMSGGTGCYKSIGTGNATSNAFFSTFFLKLGQNITDKNKQLKDEQDAQDKLKGDIDILTQTYYSFKNINDKWLTGPTTKTNNTGYPFNRKGSKLIDSFAFVDRAMNPIGDTIINAELLLQIFDDPNISVFSALSQLLSSNGFEFFPLQNFMNFGQKTDGSDEKAWEESFKIDMSGLVKSDTAFVCMYIGGASSYPSVSSNGFQNDGIINIAAPGVGGFSTNSDAIETQETNFSEFPWKAVRAFRVRFGEQNQSMFTDVKIESKEYPETNESIQILSRLAGDNKINAPTPKGQNLYNLYENRSYNATVTSFGNVMIQPTQYFQLENVPMYNGAYIILSVEHNITPNKMTTTFSGTKMLKYPSPRVLSPVAFVGFSDISNLSAGQFTQAALTSNIDKTKFNSMYTFKIE